ncbi:BZ3500_MvSof-1268-A1-R1_Chr4-4g07564 [Microbotryum saponariae]|uniref:BZ3500_MvSof-1268-A1-R1_Chr4-4g07564 protein n=1 Tax=Microbotryum saponariae TaxID=289078 RepID=A0A2X0KWA4_9BASI|nr:BZ3500_MvSof-1268-A1-R1_Chr4-4g07564 [Microbotryum saponariae]
MSSTSESDFSNGSGNRLYLKDTQGYKSWSQRAFINLEPTNYGMSVQVADKVAEYRERAIRRNDLACKYIANSISEEQMSHLIHLTSAYEMWDTLRGLHSHGRPSHTMDLLNTLAQPYAGDIPFKEFVNKVKIAMTDFQNLGAPLPHWLFAGMLVRSLPAQYDSIVGNLYIWAIPTYHIPQTPERPLQRSSHEHPVPFDKPAPSLQRSSREHLVLCDIRAQPVRYHRLLRLPCKEARASILCYSTRPRPACQIRQTPYHRLPRLACKEIPHATDSCEALEKKLARASCGIGERGGGSGTLRLRPPALAISEMGFPFRASGIAGAEAPQT